MSDRLIVVIFHEKLYMVLVLNSLCISSKTSSVRMVNGLVVQGLSAIVNK